MIGVDTNVILRLLVDDQSAQCGKARDFFSARSPRDPAFVSSVVLAELIWLLRRRFGYPSETILDVLRRLTASADFRFEHSEHLQALLAEDGIKVTDVADALIAWSCMSEGCDRVVTFDRRSARLVSGMELLS